MTFVLDTHALVWFLGGSRRLSERARDAINDKTAGLVVPAFVIAEISFHHAHGRFPTSPEAALEFVRTGTNSRLYLLNERVIDHLPSTLDIHDGIIVATALVVREAIDPDTALISRDDRITASGLIPIVW